MKLQMSSSNLAEVVNGTCCREVVSQYAELQIRINKLCFSTRKYDFTGFKVQFG
jgi:hypothetical protein